MAKQPTLIVLAGLAAIVAIAGISLAENEAGEREVKCAMSEVDGVLIPTGTLNRSEKALVPLRLGYSLGGPGAGPLIVSVFACAEGHQESSGNRIFVERTVITSTPGKEVDGNFVVMLPKRAEFENSEHLLIEVEVEGAVNPAVDTPSLRLNTAELVGQD